MATKLPVLETSISLLNPETLRSIRLQMSPQGHLLSVRG